MNLGDLLKIGAWLQDADGDGLADDLSVGIVLTDGLGQEARNAAALLAARLGLETAAVTLPVCYADGSAVRQAWRIIVGQTSRQWPDQMPAAAGAIQLAGRDLLLAGNDQQLATLLHYLAVHFPRVGQSGKRLQDWQRDLEQAFGCRFSCRSLRLQPSGLQLVMEREDGQLENSALVHWMECHQTAQLALEDGRLLVTVAMDWAVLETEVQAAPNLVCLSRLLERGGLLVDRDQDFLPDDLNGCLPSVSDDLSTAVAQVNFAARVGLETLGLSLQPTSGRAAETLFAVKGAADGETELKIYGGRVQLQAEPAALPAVWRYLAEDYPQTPVGCTWSELLLRLEGWVRNQPLDGSWQEVSLEWEVDEAIRAFEELVRQVGGPLRAEIRVSEPLTVRESLRERLLATAAAHGLPCTELLVRSAHKQGLQWIREEIIPELLQLGLPLERCLIQVAAFRPGDQALDPHARWLLELHPADLLLAEALGLEPEQVQFELVEGGEHTYCLKAIAAGAICYQREFTVWYTRLPYLPLLGEAPTVHPATGGIAWSAAGESGQRSIATDLERVFSVYQQTILPQLVTAAERAGGLLTAKQPFFERLHLQVTLSEPEERLGIREELLSPADALHEDLHFVGLDLFKRLGEENGQQLRSPGLILPEVTVRAGQAPHFQYRLSACADRQLIERPTLQAVQFAASGCIAGARLHWQAADAASAEHIAVALSRHAGEPAGLQVEVQIDHPTGSRTAVCWVNAATPEAPVENAGIVYAEQCEARLHRLSQQPGARAEVMGVSRQGRPILGAAVTSPAAGRLVSSAKLAGWKPTYLLNNRHHANEVSSTNAALDLLDWLAASSDGQALLRRINVAAIPLENVDGAALHQQLAAENPNHKLHAARFNSLGREFADAYFLDDQSAPEARALTDLWRRYVPDIVADNHGIPSHEWDQPFSGYLCPWFSSFWIPRSLFYVYFWYVDHPACPSRQVALALEQAMSGELGYSAEFQRTNRELIASWRKYFLPYLDDHFAGEQREGMIWYYVPSGPDPTRRFASHRWPHLTVLDFTTEVADETAQAEYLELCAGTHQRAQMACLRWLAESPVEMVETLQLDQHPPYRCRRRKRPLTLPDR